MQEYLVLGHQVMQHAKQSAVDIIKEGSRFSVRRRSVIYSMHGLIQQLKYRRQDGNSIYTLGRFTCTAHGNCAIMKEVKKIFTRKCCMYPRTVVVRTTGDEKAVAGVEI